MEFHGTKWYFIWQHQSSMEFHGIFHGTKLYFIRRYQSSMEFHGIFHGIPWNNCVIWNGTFRIPWNHLELGGIFYLATPESHGIPWNIPWKFRVTWYWRKWQYQSSMEFHGTKWYFIWRHRVPWNSMEHSMEFHGTHVSFEMAPSNFHRITWNSVIFLFVDSKLALNFMEYPMEALGNMVLNKMTISMWYFVWRHQSSMEFHGIFHGIPWN